MKTFSKLSVLGVLLILVGGACEKNLHNDYFSDSANPLSKYITSVDGILKFQNMTSFKTTLESLKSKKNFEEFENSYSLQNFVSMRERFSALNDFEKVEISQGITSKYEDFLTVITLGEEREVVRNVGSDALATLLNKEGKVIIGGELHKFLYDKMFIVKDYENSKSLRLDRSTQANREIEICQVKRGSLLHHQNNNAKINGNTRYMEEYWSDGRKCRLAGSIDYENWTRDSDPYLVNVYCYTKHQTRSLWSIWWTTSINTIRLRVEFDGYNLNGFQGHYGPFNIISQNDGWVQFDMPSACVNTPNDGYVCSAFYRNVSTQHSGICWDGQDKLISLFVSQ
ncbi:MAG: hypothetical protein ACK4GN_01360 [Runella sp.]